MTSLAELKPGEKGEVKDLTGPPAAVQRLLEMGLTEGEPVEVIRYAPTGDPIEIRIRGYHLSLRKTEASSIEVERL